ncbi:hypothetical protein, partial [Agathobaculum sp.]|uniref:hypothetical protein n=1 Tax=Agathobaculum sp. TaxID=2048138 RepID=UPI0039A0CC3D
ANNETQMAKARYRVRRQRAFFAERWKNTAKNPVHSWNFHPPPTKNTHGRHLPVVCCKLYPGETAGRNTTYEMEMEP